MHRTSQLMVTMIALPLGLAMSLAGCSSDGSDDPTTGTTTASSSSPDPSDAASPSESTEPSVTPASGPILETPGATINLPKGFKADDFGIPNTVTGSAGTVAQHREITMIDLGEDGPSQSLDVQAKQARTLAPSGAKLTREADVELDGSPAYYLTGTEPLRGDYTAVGTMDRGRALDITFTLNGYSKAERQEIIDSVIASFQWKE